MRQFIGSSIRQSVLSEWREENMIVLIEAGTGKGKTTWALTELYEFAKANNEKILILQNRRAAETQFIKDVLKNVKDDIITISKYQNLERGSLDISGYGYIICDEAHYFATDCSFNPRTDDSYKKIMEMKNASQLVFMTATGEGIFEMIKRDYPTIDYNFGSDYSGIKEVIMFSKKDYIENKLNSIVTTDRKALVFLDGIEELIETYGIFKHKAMFTCSKSKVEYQDLIDEALVNEMTDTRKLPRQLLFATSALDTGFNLEDTSITDVFCSSPEIYKIIQWIGRVRIQEGQQITVHIRNVNKYQVGGRYSQLLEIKKQIDTLKRSQEEFRALMRKEYIDEKYFYVTPETTDFQINVMAEERLYRRIRFYQDILSKNNFMEKLQERLGKEIRVQNKEDELERLQYVLGKYENQKIIGKEKTKQLYAELKLYKKYTNNALKLMTKPNEINQEIDTVGYKINQGVSRQGRFIEVIKLHKE